MKLSKRMPESRYFSSLFVYSSTLTAVIVLAVSYILYVNFVNIEQKKIFSFSEESLSQISSTADSMQENVKMTISQILNDREIYKVFYQSDTDPIETKTITDRINLIGSLPFLQSVYVYSNKLDLYYTGTAGSQKSAYFPDQGIVDILKTYKPEMNLKPITRTIKNAGNDGNIDYNVYTYIYYDPSFDGSIILNITDSWMKKAIATIDKSQSGGIIILDSAGVLVSSIYNDQILSDLSSQEFVQDILHSREESGHFIGNVDGVKSLVTYASSDALDWKFVRYTPYGVAFKEVDKMRTRTLLLCLLLILVGLSLSYVTSRRLNRPVADMLKKMGVQDRTIRENSYKAKQDFLRQLMMEDGSFPPNILVKRFAEHSIKLNLHDEIQVLILKIDRYKAFCRQYEFKDRSLLRFGIMNIASEIFSEYAPCEAVDSGDDHTVILFHGRNVEELDNRIVRIQQEIKEYLKLSVTAAVSLLGTDASECRSCYMDALETSRYRVFSGWEAHLFAEQTAEQQKRPYRYPIQKEELLTDALMLGKMDEVKNLCSMILESTVDHSYKDLNLTVFRLFFAVNMVVDTLEKASGFSYAIQFNEMFAHLAEMERLSDISDSFLDIFRQIEEKLGEKKSAKYEELIRKINTIIENDYMKQELGLDSIADVLNMSPVYLGRLIKKQTSKSITDYINEIRIGKAAELLSATDRLISEISIDTGFASTSYFGRVFKKINGITPNEYRQKWRGETGHV
ncbi:AraC family transcriptional regulator [Paenibacillus oryzisoli]|uniref:AraC family transcriptional regulator n=1 Tax=Paenibacillus oryzisoli TaxID=1850517 RepID=UPI003D2CB25F